VLVRVTGRDLEPWQICQGSIYLVIGNASRPCHIAEQRMKRVLLFSLGWLMVTFSAQTATLPQLYAPQGELLLAHLASAPFPHPQRAQGHKYKDQFYPAAEHYSNDTVAIFIPKGFRETGLPRAEARNICVFGRKARFYHRS
jgi:hypothetical protein